MKTIKLSGITLFLISTAIIITSFIKGDDKKKIQEDPTTLYSMGEVKAFSPDSIPYGTYVALTKEIMNRKEKKITMKSITIDQKGETKEYNYYMDIEDPKFIIHDVDSNYTGVGKLHGKAWEWTSWNYSIYFTNPAGRMEAYNYVSLVGLVVNKAFYGPDGKMVVKYKERHKFITKEQFEILYLQVLKCYTK